uniref:Ion transport domain-containing protein n=2 Tax=Meloidogyne TaxID=189290 RepID=A0A914L7A2_MELIC
MFLPFVPFRASAARREQNKKERRRSAGSLSVAAAQRRRRKRIMTRATWTASSNAEGSTSTRLLIAKAAFLSSTMLQQQQPSTSTPQTNQQQLKPGQKVRPDDRRRSGLGTIKECSNIGIGLTQTQLMTPNLANKRDSMAMIADLLAATSLGPARKLPQSTLLEHPTAKRILKLACLISLINVCFHTPRTIQLIPNLNLALIIGDAFVVGVFTLEAFTRSAILGLIQRPDSYLRDRWCQFDFLLLLFHWASWILHLYQIGVKHIFPSFGFVYYDWLGIIRCVRPMIILRLIRLMITVKVPRQRIQQLLKRSSTQVQNVTVFFLFFMALYAIMGIQLFGRMDYHCVLPGTDPKNVTINDLAIPDTMCSKDGGGGYECPENMECMKLDLSAKSEGFYGMFDHFGASVFTVYLAASEEGWVYVLYDCLDSLPSHFAFVYFVTLIFFLAWLVKNVFIAVITETFAEIRVQFSESWKKEERTKIEDDFKQKIERSDDGWKLIRLDKEEKLSPRIKKFQNILRSTAFQCIIVTLVLANAGINASFVYKHDESDAKRREIYYWIEVAFTILFDIECFIKLLCYGKQFFKRNIYKFELILVIGGTLNVFKYFYHQNYFTYFQVFRLLRLIKASPMLEDFVYKIFSPGKKLGGLVLFTFTFAIWASAVSLQLFCTVPNLTHFQTFPQAFMAMFQIITQEGWTEFVVEVLRMIDDRMVPFVAIYFVAYHLFVTLIVLSLFVAVILDNLEMDEELKKVKQLKAKEATAVKTTLPWRLRIFEKFPTRPQMVHLKKVVNEFNTPKVRDSFTNQFVWSEKGEQSKLAISTAKLLTHLENKAHTRMLSKFAAKSRSSSKKPQDSCLYKRYVGHCSMRSLLKNLVKDASKEGQSQMGGMGLGPSSTKARGKSMSFFEQILTENGDINREHVGQTKQANTFSGATATATTTMTTSTRRDLKQGQFDIRALQHKQQMAEITRNRIEEEMRENHPYFDRPLFIIARDSKLRRYCHRIVHARWGGDGSIGLGDTMNGGSRTANAGGGTKRNNQIHELLGLMPYLDWTMVLITLISCGSMLFENPWPTTGENLVMFNFYLQIPDYLFVLAMTLELIAKMIADGLFFTPNALINDFGGVMTVFIYLTSLTFLILMPKHVEINSLEQFLMICRAMRPLRIYTLVPHIRRVVLELFRGFKEILLVTILMIVVMFIFASFGVQTVGGKLAACNDLTIKHRNECHGVFWQKVFVTRLEIYGKNNDTMHPKVLVPRVWTNPRNFNFDHIGAAMLALFETLSYKGWNVIRDILWARQGPWAVVFIHIYVFIGCMIGLTLFVGVVIANYTENRGTALLTVDQRRWHDLKARLKMAQPLHIPPKPSESAIFRRSIYELTMSRFFNQLFAALVVLNSATLIFPWNVEEEEMKNEVLFIVTVISAALNLLFAVEVLLKMFAFTVTGFWQSRRNRLDLLITGMGLFWISTHFFVALPASAVGGESRLKRFTYTFGYIVVILRFFTIAGRNNTLKMLMLTVVMSMFRSFFIIMAMVLLVLFYAYTGVILFGMVKYGQAVSKHVNFRSGSEALVVLFRSVTGEDWNDIMHDTSRSAPFCYWLPGANYWETDCGNYFGAIIYFCSFYLIITYIVRNLLVAIIMENFSLFYSSEEDALLSYADIRNFQMVWNAVDVEQKGQIPVRRVKFLLRLLKGRLEVDPNKDRLLFKHMCYEMEKLHNGDDVSFQDVLYMLSYRSVDIRKSLQLEELLQREELEYIIEEEVAKQTIKTWLEFCLRQMRSPGLPPSQQQQQQQFTQQKQLQQQTASSRSSVPIHKPSAFTFSAKSIYAFDSATLAAAHSKVAIERHQRQSLGSPRISPSKQSKIVDDKEFVGENVDGKEEFLEEENIGELNNNNYQPQRKSSLSDILEGASRRFAKRPSGSKKSVVALPFERLYADQSSPPPFSFSSTFNQQQRNRSQTQRTLQLSAHELLPDLEESQSEENQLTVGSGSSIIVNKRVKSIEHSPPRRKISSLLRLGSSAPTSATSHTSLPQQQQPLSRKTSTTTSEINSGQKQHKHSANSPIYVLEEGTIKTEEQEFPPPLSNEEVNSNKTQILIDEVNDWWGEDEDGSNLKENIINEEEEEDGGGEYEYS